jgi:ankyrin
MPVMLATTKPLTLLPATCCCYRIAAAPLPLQPAVVNARNEAGDTALGLALFKGHAKVMQVLLENGADAKLTPRSEGGGTYLHAAAAADVCSAAAISLLVESAGLSTEAHDADGRCALHVVARTKTFDAAVRVKLFVLQGAAVDGADSAGMTALHHAAEQGASEVLKQLLELGADKGGTDKQGRTALEVAKQVSGDCFRPVLALGKLLTNPTPFCPFPCCRPSTKSVQTYWSSSNLVL